MEEKVKEILSKIRPQLQADGGDIEFVSMQDSEVKVKLKGACHGCPGAQMTLKMGVERALKQHVDESITVVSV
ncbi:MAG TPA: NifU family protein [bacterium]|nr:MAG: Fe/S biogenesis protein NfuA [bacterium ADurb.Bin236]HPI75522.1 NifU family protein [bacterium]